MTKKFNGFTLAEVLITLGIIGVVAAMTMPTLINQTNGAQYRAAYKKALSAISQGVTLNVALDDISFADTVKGTAGSTAAPDNGKSTSVASLLKSRMNIVKESSTAGYTMTGGANNKLEIVVPTGCSEEGKTVADCPTDKLTTETQEKDPTTYFDTFLFFNDSSMIAFKNDDTYACTQTSTSGGNKTCVGLIDVNGAKGPNKFVTCDAKTNAADPCEVKSPTDIYPVIFYDQTILPANDAGKAVLYGK